MCAPVAAIPVIWAAVQVAVSAAAAGVATAGSFVAANAGTIAAVGSLAASGVGAAGVIQQGQTAKKASEINAENQRKTAISVEDVGAQQAADQKLKAKKIEASQVAQAGAGGVDPATGTPLTMEGLTAEFGELDSLRIINNAQRTAWGLRAQSNIGEYEGSEIEKASYLNAGSSLLGGVSNAYFGSKRA